MITDMEYSLNYAIAGHPFIKQEPQSCEGNLPVSTIKQEPVDTTEDLSGFDPHAWVLDHLKIETEESILQDQYAPCRYGNLNDKQNYSYVTYNYHPPQGQDVNFSQMASCSNPAPRVNSVWNNVEKVFYCEICHKSFSTKGNLGNHMRSHTQEKPFKCNTCGRCFSFNCNLKTHYLTHTGIKPFQCTTCGKCFSTKGNMSVHLRIHTGERPYKCSICFRSFTVKDNLQRHMKIHIPL